MYLWGIDMASAFVLHLLSAVVWVGGMFFAYMALRPAAVDVLEPPLRLRLWVRVFVNFFPWVWTAVVTLLLTGYGMLFAFFGGMAGAPIYVHVMQGVGILMMLLFGHIYFAPFRRLKKAVAAEDWQMGGAQLAQVRQFVGLNLVLGLVVVLVASGGRMITF